MNWSNYIIMQWLPTYLTRSLNADKGHIMLTAVPYIVNSLVGVGKLLDLVQALRFLSFFHAQYNLA